LAVFYVVLCGAAERRSTTPHRSRRAERAEQSSVATSLAHLIMSEQNSNSAAEDTCYRCKQTGHRAKDCPTKAKKASETSNSSTAAPKIPTEINKSSPAAESAADICYRCKQPGHLASKCPTKAKNKALEASTAPISRPAADISQKKRKAEELEQNGQYSEKFNRNREKSGKTFSNSANSKPRKATESSSEPKIKKIKLCGRCGSSEHLALDCKQEKSCFHCKSSDHLGKNCPNFKQEKPCFTCSATDHISRLCPTLKHRVIYRNEGKERSELCYICKLQGHHAVECPKTQQLHSEFTDFMKKPAKFTVAKLNDLLQLCCRCLEYKATVHLYGILAENPTNIAPNSYTALVELHQAAGKPQVTLAEKFPLIEQVRKPKQALKNIVDSYKFNVIKPKQLNSQLNDVLDYLRENFSTISALKGRISLAEALRKHFSATLSAKQARELVKLLLTEYYLFEFNNGKLLFDLDLSGAVKEKALEKEAKKELQKKSKGQKNQTNGKNGPEKSKGGKGEGKEEAAVKRGIQLAESKDKPTNSKIKQESKDGEKIAAAVSSSAAKKHKSAESRDDSAESKPKRIKGDEAQDLTRINSRSSKNHKEESAKSSSGGRGAAMEVDNNGASSADICFRCKQSGHFASKCPLKKKAQS
jgi:hypothetical protein